MRDINLPNGWRDAETGVKAMDHFVEETKYDLSPDSIARQFAAEQERAFYIGVMYGMALEATKDRPLQERHYFE